jgi:hypothetical protein
MTMKLNYILLTAGLALSAPAFAAISPGNTQTGTSAPYNGIGELFLAVYDDQAKISYAKDLGVTQNAFFVDGQNKNGFTKTWSLDDDYWTEFLGKVSLKNLQWTVLAVDQIGGIGAANPGTGAGGIRLFTTVKAGDEAKVGATRNSALTTALGAAQIGTFFDAVNTTGSHGTVGVALDFGVNGASVNADADPGNAYFGIPGSGPTLNGNMGWSSGNAVDTASKFFAVTRSSTTASGFVAIDRFNNPDAPAIEGSFLLSSGQLSSRLVDGLNSSSGYSLTYALAPVPEPQTYALMLLGLGALGAVARRRKAG